MKNKLAVIHTADWHLGKNRKHADYLEQQRMMLQAILDIVVETIDDRSDSDVWLIVAGDVFDRNEDTGREEFVLPILHILYPLMEMKQKHSNFSFYFIDGNHDRQPYDPSDPNSQASVVSPLVKMAEGHIAVADPMYIDDKKLLLVPFGQHSVESLHSLLDEHPASFMVMHECCAGITTDVGWKPPRDQDQYIDIGKLLKGAQQLDAVFLGDIHRSQPLDGEGICVYSGSPVTLDHGHKMPKGVLIHDFELKNDRWERSDEPELRSLLPYAPGLKIHVQLGVLDDTEVIPYSTLAKYQTLYLQMTVSADVYALIVQRLPDIFTSPNVSWEYKSEDIARAIPGDKSAEESQSDYYKPLIHQWVEDNGKELTTEDKAEAAALLMKDFAERS